MHVDSTKIHMSLLRQACFCIVVRYRMPPAECIGEFPSGRPCTLGKHGKVQLHGDGKCKKCHEKRCRSHCCCARTGILQGRARGRACANRALLVRAKAAARPPLPGVELPLQIDWLRHPAKGHFRCDLPNWRTRWTLRSSHTRPCHT